MKQMMKTTVSAFVYVHSVFMSFCFNHLVGEIVHITRKCLCYDDAITLKFPEVHL